VLLCVVLDDITNGCAFLHDVQAPLSAFWTHSLTGRSATSGPSLDGSIRSILVYLLYGAPRVHGGCASKMGGLQVRTALLLVVIMVCAFGVAHGQQPFEIAVVQGPVTSSYSAAIQEGTRQFAAENPDLVSLHWYEAGDVLYQESCIREATFTGVDAIVIEPMAAFGLGSAVADAVLAGIVVVMAGGCDYEAPSDMVVLSDPFPAGADTAWEAIRQLQSPTQRPRHPQGASLQQDPWQIIALSWPSHIDWRCGVTYTLDPLVDAGHATVHFLDPDYDALQSLIGQVGADAIIVGSDDLVEMASAAVQYWSALDDIVTVATGWQRSIELVDRGELTAALVPIPHTIGYWSIQAAVRLLQGTWDNAPELLDVPWAVITGDNVSRVSNILQTPRRLPAEPIIMSNYVGLLIGLDYGPNQMWGDDAEGLASAMVNWLNWQPVVVPNSLSSPYSTLFSYRGPYTGAELGTLIGGFVSDFREYEFDQSGDTLFFFFASGHGSNPMEPGDSEIPLPNGMALNACDETIATWGAAITDDVLADYERSLPGSDAILKVNLIDTCFSGGFWGGGDSGDLDTLQRTVLIASAPEDLTAGGDSPLVKSLVIGIIEGYSAGSDLEATPGMVAPADSTLPVLVQESWVHRNGRWCRGNGNQDGMITIDEWFYWGYNAVDVLPGHSAVCSGYDAYGEATASEFEEMHVQQVTAVAVPGRDTAATEPCVFWSRGCRDDFLDPFGLNPFGNVVLFVHRPTDAAPAS